MKKTGGIYLEIVMMGLIVLSLICLSVPAAAQVTKVRGRVMDKADGSGLPFAAVYFEGTTIGVSTDMDGYYSMETRDSSACMLTASLLGYEPQTVRVSRGGFSEVDFRLESVTSSLNAAVVKPDNRYMKWILGQIDRNKDRNDPERRDAYLCDTYTKMELDIANADERIRSKLFRKNFGFVFDYMDTSALTGKAYLPVMISETLAHRRHSSSPEVNREVIEATRVSGLNEDNAVSQFTGSMHLKINFYDNFIDAFNIQIPSPLSSSGNLYYNYYLVDSLMIDGRKTWKIRFHPARGISSSVFDGEMNIDAKDFALREIHAKLVRGANVNWIRDLAIDRTDRQLEDSSWFFKQDRLYVDFSVTMRDSSKMMSFLGSRQTEYMNPLTGPEARAALTGVNADVQGDGGSLKKSRPAMADREAVHIEQGAGGYDDKWWDAARPYRLSMKEQNIYNMVDSIKNVPLYNNIYNLVNTVISGYLETKYVAFGPYSQLYSFNRIEGSRVQFGMRTTPEISRKIRVGGYLAYGFRDREFKGGGSLEWMLSRQPTLKLTFSGKHDMMQLGKGDDAFNESSILTSILSKKGSAKRSPVNDWQAKLEWEAAPWLNVMTSLQSRRIFANAYVPMLRVGAASGDTLAVNSVGANELRFVTRFSKDEIVTRGIFEKSYLYSDYPVVTVDLLGSLKGIGRNEYSYFRSEVSVDWRLNLPPVGTSRIQFTAGKIVGTVPYPMLKLHEGNGTYILDQSAFSCMEFYEFASDTWTTLFYEHNFGGFFLGKIPLLKKLHWREVFTMKAAYGTLSRKNNGIPGSAASSCAPMLFPAGMTSLNKPYVELGAGISNIFRLLRVDAFWRMTHRYIDSPDGTRIKSPNCFVVNIGLELSF